MPHDLHALPPWEAVYQQLQRWLKAGVFEAIVHDLRVLLRLAEGRKAQPSAAIFDSRTLQSSVERGARGLRRGQAAQGQQSASGGGYPGPLAGAACDGSQ